MVRSIGALAFVVALSFGVAPAGANLDANAVGAAVALPFVTTSGGAKTYIAVTNAGSEAITVEGRILEGNSLTPNYVEHGRSGSGVEARDPDANWGIVDFECSMTPKEALFFEVTWAGDAAQFEVVGGPHCGNPKGSPTLVSGTGGGMIFLSVKRVPGLRAENVLFADWAVVDLENSLAFSAEGISFQAAAGRDGIPGVFAFDDLDFSAFPGALTANFLLPASGCDLLTNRRCFALILFSLDGVVGSPPTVPISIEWYDQFERRRSGGFTFDCWAFAYLRPGVSTGSVVGHMELKPRTGGRAFHGWIVQRDTEGGRTWARRLAESSTNGPTAVFTTQ